MSDLLIVEDERELAEFLCEEIGAKLLLSDVACDGQPSVAANPAAALPPRLAIPAKLGAQEVYDLIFWLPDCGGIKTLADAMSPADGRDRVSRSLTRDAADAAGVDVENVIDLERTPVITLHRSTQQARNRIAPGALGSMPLPIRDIPNDVRSRYARSKHWLHQRAVKIDPFMYCPEMRERRPKHLGPRWVWVQPHAMKLVEEGTEIWPWTS